MGKRNRNRGNKGNNGNHTTETAKDVMVKIMNLLDSGAILDAITDRRVISSASDRLVNHDYEIEAFDQIVDLFQISLTSSEIRAVVNVLNPVIFTLGDIPTKESDIAVLVYQKFVEYLGKNGQDKDCIKSYETLMAVREIVQSDLDDIGKSVSEDTLTTLAVVEMLYTVTDLLVGQVWDDMRMAASSSNIPDRDKVEVVINTEPPKQESKAEKIPDDQVEVLEIESDDVKESELTEVKEPDSTNTSSKESNSDKIFGVSNDMIKTLLMTVIDSNDVDKVVNQLVDLVKPVMSKTMPNMSEETTEALKGLVKSMIKDNIPTDIEKIEQKTQVNNIQKSPEPMVFARANVDRITDDILPSILKYVELYKSTLGEFSPSHIYIVTRDLVSRFVTSMDGKVYNKSTTCDWVKREIYYRLLSEGKTNTNIQQQKKVEYIKPESLIIPARRERSAGKSIINVPENAKNTVIADVANSLTRISRAFMFS